MITAENTERHIREDDANYLVATTDYVATISKHYKPFFSGKDPVRTVGPYNAQFEAAVRRLAKVTGSDGWEAIGMARWLRTAANEAPN